MTDPKGTALSFADPAALDRWFAAYAATRDGLWIRLCKKGSGQPCIDWAGCGRVALAWGWIDGGKRSAGATCRVRLVSAQYQDRTGPHVSGRDAACGSGAGPPGPPGRALAGVRRAASLPGCSEGQSRSPATILIRALTVALRALGPVRMT